MIARDDFACIQRGMPFGDVFGHAVIHAQVKHLIKIAVVQISLPIDGNQRAAHHSARRGWIEGADQRGHVLFVFACRDQKIKKSPNRHVRNAVQFIEDDAEFVLQNLLVIGFEYVLIRWKRRAAGIVNQVQLQSLV